MDLFLNDEVPQAIKKLVADRIREVEGSFTKPALAPMTHFVSTHNYPPQETRQAPSMQKIMEQNPDLIPPAPVTQAAVQALQSRAKLIQGRENEKPEPGRTGPRKF